MKRIAVPAALVVVMLLAALWWVALSRNRAAETAADAAASAAATSAAASRAATPKPEVIAIPPQAAAAKAAAVAPSQAARFETRDAIRDAPDLRAYYERTKDFPDPTGERSYRFAEAIFECTPFMDLPTPQLSARLAVTERARDSARRQEVFNAMVERCKGFSGNPAGTMELVGALHRKAEAAGYPAEVARTLRLEAGRKDPDWADRTAQGMLSAPIPDPDVVHELGAFLNLRMQANPAYRGLDAGTRSIAWGLLECQYGADCGPRSRPVVMTCITLGACDLTSIEEAVFVQSSQETLNKALAMRDQLARQIAERDWNTVGFAPRFKAP